ncbi:MAG: hypothetical protein HQK54_09600 [Oligoflexales bacterium]|nr:hypothetical protein [Oligoflexales bacterium]
MRVRKLFVILIGFMLSKGGQASVSGGDERLNLDLGKYPIISDIEMGHLRYSIKIARQSLEDFSLIPPTDVYWIGGSGKHQATMSSTRYTLGFMTYFLALEQFSKIPAYTELVKPTMDRMIQKMLQREVWSYWAEVSRGVPPAEPNLDRPYPEEHDPVANRNIMYSGHLAHMVSLYEKLYGDFKWAAPNSMEFAWSDKEKYYYDTHLLHKVIYDQFVRLPDHAIECSPNMAFPVCNQHPVIALMLYDQIYKTSYFPTVRKLHTQFYLDNQIIDPKDHTVAGLMLVKQHTVVNRRNPRFGNVMDLVIRPLNWMHIVETYTGAVDGWNGAFMNGWDPESVKEHYPYQKKDYVVVKNDKIAYIKHKGAYEQLSAPFFAVLAAEMGDLKLRDQLINWSASKFKAQWDREGGYFYPAGVEMPITIWPSTRFRGVPLTDKLAALASANSKDGIRKMHLEPFPGADEKSPRVEGVPFPMLLIRRAIYDPSIKSLIITAKPGVTGGIQKASLRVTRLDPKETWNLYVDGRRVNTYTGSDQVTIAVDLQAQHDIVLKVK